MNRNISPDLIILFSGGADSVCMLEFAKELYRNPHCLLVDYNQKHIKELDVAKNYLKKRNVPFNVIKINGLDVGSGLTGNGNPGTYKNVHPMYVPSRNLLFISLAASYAEAGGISEIWYGANKDDIDNAFPDCQKEWINKVNKILEINGSYPIILKAPLIAYTKDMVLYTLKNVYGINESNFFSGYGD